MMRVILIYYVLKDINSSDYIFIYLYKKIEI